MGSRPQSFDALFYVDFFLLCRSSCETRFSAEKGNERKLFFWRAVVRVVTGHFLGRTDSEKRGLAGKR